MYVSQKNIIHMDLDTFFVSVERLHNSELIGKPVIVGGLSDRGVVAGCSYEARTYGVHSAMPMKMARALCGDAIIIRGDMDEYSKYSHMVTDIIAEAAPVYEKASIDEHYIDISGMDRFFGSVQWSHELRNRIIRETGLPISLGFSTNKTVSKIATGQAKPNGECFVPQQEILPFLDPLSIKKIPGIGEKTFHTLRSMGIATIKTLRLIPPDLMGRVLGKNGHTIWEKANGIDNTPVQPYTVQKSMSSERTFEQDTIDIDYLNRVLIQMVEKLTFELRQDERLTSCITLKIRYSNFDTHTLQKRIPYTAFDHVLISEAKDLFKRLYQRRMLIRLLGVKLSGMVHGTPQLSLFENVPEMGSLYRTMDKIRNRYGAGALVRAIGMKEYLK